MCLCRHLASVKLAIILILILTVLSLIGTFLVPVKLFHSWWFFTPGVLLMLNILICTISRCKRIRTLIKGGRINQPESFFTNSENKSEAIIYELPQIKIFSIIENTLNSQGYRVRSESEEDQIYLAADKNRYFKFGTFASHISLILFVLAYIIGSCFGFRDNNFIVAEGETREVGHNTDLSLKLVSFTDEYYSDNTPKDFRSQVILYKSGQEVDQDSIRVNQPLIYKGTRFYQSFFGPAIKIKVEEKEKLLFQGNIALGDIVQSQGYQRYAGNLDLTEKKITIRFIGSATNIVDQMIPKGKIAVEVLQEGEQIGLALLEKTLPLQIGDLEFTYQDDAQYSGFQVSRDPGNFLIWIASSLFIIGITLVLFFVYRQLWLLIQKDSAGSRVYFRMSSQKGLDNRVELKKIVKAIDKVLSESDNT